MNTKKALKLFALIAVIALLFTACGAKEEAPSRDEAAPAPQGPVELGIQNWTMDAAIWSGSNGASIELTATPKGYEEGMTASFVVRLEGEDVVNNPCEWNGTAFTSFADLNAEDGYGYYVVLTGADGETLTVDLNTPTVPTDTALISLATSLESHCTSTISDAPYDKESEILTINQGTATIQPSRISADGKPVTCTEARLILSLDGGALALEKLEIPAELNGGNSYTIDLSGITFRIPKMEGDHQLTLALSAELSNGQTLEDESSTSWFYSDGEVSLSVG